MGIIPIETYGMWNVTTEGAEAGTIRRLGIYKGHINDIAFTLEDKARYVLFFENVSENIPFCFVPKVLNSSPHPVNICINDISEITSPEALNKVREIFRNRPVNVDASIFYKALVLTPSYSKNQKWIPVRLNFKFNF